MATSIFQFVSDTSETLLTGPLTIPDSPATAYTAPIVDGLNFGMVDWSLNFSHIGTITELTVTAWWSGVLAPNDANDADWQPLLIDAIDTATGESPVQVYQLQVDPSAYGGVPLRIGFSTKVRGRWLRLKVTATAGSGVGSVLTASYYRRVNAS